MNSPAKIQALGLNDGNLIHAISGYEYIQLISDSNVDDTDIFILQAENVRMELLCASTGNIYSPQTTLVQTRDGFDRAVKSISNKIGRIRDVISHGSIMIVALKAALPASQVRQTQGNGYGPAPDSAWLWPFTEVELFASSGRGLTWENVPETSDMNAIQVVNTAYSSGVTSKNGFPILRIPTKLPTENNFAGWTIKVGKGLVCFLPLDLLNALQPGGIQRFAELVHSLAQQTESTSTRPNWLLNVSDFNDAAKIETKEAFNQQLKTIGQQVAAIEVELKGARWKYDLLYQTDDQLVAAVLQALSIMNISAFPGPHPHAEFLAKVRDTLIFAEVKGVDGAAKNNAICQIQNWRIEVERALSDEEAESVVFLKEYKSVLTKLGCFDLEGKQAPNLKIKGLLVINTHHETPIWERPALDSRTGENFPPAFLAKLEEIDVAVVTSCQLLGALTETDGYDSFWESTISTKGLVTAYRDHSKFLKTWPDRKQ